MDTYRQMDLFHDNDDLPAAARQTDPRPPVTVTWNLWHGCINYVEDYITIIMRFYPYVKQYR